MKISNLEKIKDKDLFVFDLDGTIVETKSLMDAEMALLMARLLAIKKVAIIGGGKYETFQELFISRLKCPEELLERLFLFPTTATAFYKYDHGWKKVYGLLLTASESQRIKAAFEEVFQEIGYKHPEKTYGNIIEDRRTQVSFSIFGQDVVKVLGEEGIRMKKKWLKDNFQTKMKIAKMLSEKLPDLEVHTAGFTTIDVTKKGINKAYGIRQIQKNLKIPIDKMLFIGDAIFPGGNDYTVVETGVDYIQVKGPEETKKIIRKVL